MMSKHFVLRKSGLQVNTKKNLEFQRNVYRKVLEDSLKNSLIQSSRVQNVLSNLLNVYAFFCLFKAGLCKYVYWSFLATSHIRISNLYNVTLSCMAPKFRFFDENLTFFLFLSSYIHALIKHKKSR